MFLSTTVVLVFLFAVFILLGRRAARRARTETPEQRAKRVNDRKDTEVALFLVQNDR